MTKVFYDTKPLSKRNRSLEIELFAAGNEHLAFQIVVKSKKKSYQDVTVDVTSLVSIENSRGIVRSEIPRSNVSVLRPSYVHLARPWRSRSRTTEQDHELDVAQNPSSYGLDFPDALPPMTPMDLDPGKAQPIWISIDVPKDAPPGDYHGEVVIRGKGLRPIKIPIELTVWHFSLPDAPSVRSMVAGYVGNPELEGVKPNSSEYEKLEKVYYDFWMERRLSGDRIPVDLLSEEAIPYYRDPRLSSFRVGKENRRSNSHDRDQDDRYEELIELWTEEGVLDKALLRISDEPDEPGNFRNIRNAVHDHPELKQVCTFNRRIPGDWSGDQDFVDLLAEDVDGRLVWCPIMSLMGDGAIVRGKLLERKDMGEELWWYQASWPKPPYPGLFIDSEAIETRIGFWQMWLHGVSGVIYWGGARWGDGNPWEDAATRPQWPNLYGDGYFVYPGEPVGVEGPVSSIRLENIRDGIEDHLYLTLYAEAFGQRDADGKAAEIVDSLTQYTHDPATLDSVRIEMGKRLDRAAKSEASR
ncbi:MAG: glycoside hydrolase domain-containing protein [Puniceicoccales bacterium]